MKRLNPKTGKAFKAGDFREDGMVFSAYNKQRLKKDGTFGERWLKPDVFFEMKGRASKATRTSQEKHRKLVKDGKITGKKRINKRTNKHYKKGDTRLDGMIFSQYDYANVRSDGTFYESWKNEKSYLKERINNIHRMAKKRAPIRDLAYDVEEDYLMSIYPKDSMCRILNKKMKWGDRSDKSNSPSLDRIDSSKGYVKGNLMWISLQANRMKQNAADADLLIFSDWIEREIRTKKKQ